MEFTKMNGLGNDFIVLSGYKELPENVAELAVRWCNRYFGIGADGLVFILPSEKADVQMRIINSDGSEPEQCGNAIRCVAKYVYDRDPGKREAITVETRGAGVQQVHVTAEKGIAKAIRVDMGEPVLQGLEIPTTIDAERVIDQPIEAGGGPSRLRRFRWAIRTVSSTWKTRRASIWPPGGLCWSSIRCFRTRPTSSL